ncbi:MAG: TerB family tellurite resistance protein [Hyphomicrobiales bacterium]|nr:TerB family tellurite resistance protein [Hyphomicrobiales bacterium]
MGFWGKLIGGVTGFAVGGPIGAFVGAMAGHAYDSLTEGMDFSPFPRIEGPEVGTTTKQAAFSVAVVVLAAKMAKADGAVSRKEIDAFKEIFRISPEDVSTVARIFDTARSDAEGYEPYARQVGSLFKGEPQVLEELLAGLFHVARADGSLTREEDLYLRNVARLMGLDTATFERVRATYHGGDSEPDAYQVLGVARTASSEEIKKVYRQLIRENHPDTLIAKGMPQEFIDVANERMASINAAYDRIEKARGLK